MYGFSGQRLAVSGVTVLTLAILPDLRAARGDVRR
jgi:hypothetical protein